MGKKGVRFGHVAKKAEKFYRGKRIKGKKYKTYPELGRAVAGKIFWRKFGKKRGKQILRRAR